MYATFVRARLKENWELLNWNFTGFEVDEDNLYNTADQVVEDKGQFMALNMDTLEVISKKWELQPQS